MYSSRKFRRIIGGQIIMGFILGFLTGVTVMCIFQINNKDRESQPNMDENWTKDGRKGSD